VLVYFLNFKGLQLRHVKLAQSRSHTNMSKPRPDNYIYIKMGSAEIRLSRAALRAALPWIWWILVLVLAEVGARMNGTFP